MSQSADRGAGQAIVGMGCMRLSTDRDRDDARSAAVLLAALDAGVTLLDTADAYCRDASETGHNERLIAGALAAWRGDRSAVRVATKGGLTRPAGRWVADGRARALAAACEASMRALDVPRIDLYQLHAPDPRTPLATSVRALEGLRRAGLVAAVGLCNVTVGQIEEARRITEVDAIQVELSLWHDASVLGGVAAYCGANRIPLLAHRPLGGADRRRRVAADPLLAELAAQHGVTPFDVALAALLDLFPGIVPLPGATRLETAQAIPRAWTIAFGADERAALRARFPSLHRSAAGPGPRASVTVPRAEGEVVLVMGLPAAGKSTVARTFAADGYLRLNRDDTGGSLKGLLPLLDRAVASGRTRVVLDNTYVSRASRAPVVQAASRHGLPVRCVWLATSIEDAQINAVSRILDRYGRLPGPDELRAIGRDVSAFGPMVQFRYQRDLEPPDPSEGFSSVETVTFERHRDPAFVNRAVIVWCDGVLFGSRSGRRTPASPDDLDVLVDRRGRLEACRRDGARLLGLSWFPDIAAEQMSAGDAGAILDRVREELDVDIEVEYCPHAAGPPACWCRKPLPGLVMTLIRRHQLDPARCVYVGAGPQDPGFARRFGFDYRSAGDFFE